MPTTNDWLTGLTAAATLGSLITWLVLLGRRWRGPFLRYQPRRPVPWGPAGALLAVLLMLLALGSYWTGSAIPPEEPEGSYEVVQRIAFGIVQQSLLVGIYAALVLGISRATQLDLGLPEYADELGHDLRIGAVGWLAALLPVFGLQALLIHYFGPQTEHPLVDMVLKEPQPIVMAFSLVAAVIVAPICEEVTFRLLLQGWLEKWEDRRLGWRVVPPVPDVLPTTGDVQHPEQAPPADATGAQEESSPPRVGAFLLPHGWVPILGSALVFSLAHVGHGVDPIPLFLLGIVLGYVYQRTHHIVPCIVTHMLFNLLSLIALGLIIYGQPG